MITLFYNESTYVVLYHDADTQAYRTDRFTGWTQQPKGTGPVVTDLLGGHIDIGVTSIAAPLPHHQKGALRILAVNAEKRAPQVPDVPTFQEVGLNVPARGSWYGLFAPRNTPPEVIAKIETLMRTLGTEPASQEVVRTLGADPVFGGTREFATAIREEEVFLDGLIKQYPLKK